MIQRYRCITLWEPFASLIAAGKKQIETRNRPTKVRGEILICAAARKDFEVTSSMERYYKEGLLPDSAVYGPPRFGQAICLAELFHCERVHRDQTQQAAFLVQRLPEEFYPEKWGWHLRNVRPIQAGVEVKGKQGFFFRDLDLEGKILPALEHVETIRLSGDYK